MTESYVVEGTTRHIVAEELGDPASYLTVRRGDRVYDLYGWAVGPVVEPRITPTRDELFDGVVVEFRGRRLFIDAPEVSRIHEGVLVLGLTAADLDRVADNAASPTQWPGGPLRVPPRRREAPAPPEDVAALTAALSRVYAADRLSLDTLERGIERVLGASTCAELDSIAAELLAARAGPGGLLSRL
jgi:hypothetical protein